MIQKLRHLVNYFGLDLTRYPSLDLRRRKKLLDFYRVDLILDVGANTGQYAQTLRRIGYKGHIVSFEPVRALFEQLEKNASNDHKWHVYNYGLGDKNEEMTIHLSENTYSSSIREQTDHLEKTAPEAHYIGTEVIILKRLDDLLESLAQKGQTIFLKMDVQGYEKNVLEGAQTSLKEISGIQLEMSLTELYEGEALFQELLTYIEQRQFTLHSLENGFYSAESGKLLQVDGIFFKEH